MTQFVEVQVKQGRLRGRRVSPPKGYPEYDAFLGVPYAKPPVGTLRFRAPQPIEPWPGVRSALEEGPCGVQVDFLTSEVIGDEECLCVNVFTPRAGSNTAEGAKAWPVMVWFHGGGFTCGSPSVLEYQPQYLCARGVVLVYVGYRVNALGFLSLGSKALPGNAGLKDAVLALRWVRENAAAFGGDPDQVTLFGASSGGAVAEYLQYAPAARGLFHRAISQSGAAAAQWGWLPQREARSRALRLARLLGCTNTDHDQDVLEFLQAVPAKDIVAKAYECLDQQKVGSRGLVFPFVPCSEAGTEGSGEEMFLEDDPRKLLHTNRFYPVPWIAGFAEYEGFFTAVEHYMNQGVSCAGEGLETVDKDMERVIPAELGLTRGSPESKAVADAVRKLYFSGGFPDKNNYYKLYTDLSFAYAIYEAARYHAAHPQAHPVYMYMFTLNCPFNLTARLYQSFNVEIPGAGHCEETGYLFSWAKPPLPAEPDFDPNSTEALARKRLTAMWTNFAKTGNPTPLTDSSVDDLEGVVWEPIPFKRDGPIHYLDIGDTLKMTSESSLCDRLTFWSDLYSKYCVV